MSYSVFRVQGIKTTGDLVGISKHNKDRISHTNQDIDLSRSKDNITLIECSNYNEKFNKIVAPMNAEHTERMKTMRADRVKTFNQHINSSKNDVACEMLFTSDSKFFEGMSRDDIRRWAEKSLDFVTKDIGIERKNILHAVVHMDEKTPHLHIVAVPLARIFNKKQNKEVWSISRRQYLNGKSQLSRAQDIYNQRMNESGYKLERGEKGSDKEHVHTEDYKRDLRRENKNLMNENEKLLEDNRRLLQANKELREGIPSDYMKYWDINNKLSSKVDKLENNLKYMKGAFDVAREVIIENNLQDKAQEKLDCFKQNNYKQSIKDYFQER